MRLRQVVVPLALALLPLALAVPALADGGATTASIVVLGGSLVITMPEQVLTLTHAVSRIEAVTLSGRLGAVEVSDARGAAAGSSWVVNVSSTAFTVPAGPSIGAAAVAYQAGPVTQYGTVTLTALDPSGLAAAAVALTATGIAGHNSATWNPTITVTLPGGAPAADYTGTITHSVT